jgi:hypothetical protein
MIVMKKVIHEIADVGTLEQPGSEAASHGPHDERYSLCFCTGLEQDRLTKATP